jgi:cystathionine beta-lyase
MVEQKSSLGVGSRLVHLARDSGRYDGLVNLPVQRGSSVLFSSCAALKEAAKQWDSVPSYGRHGTTPTFALEEALAVLHGGYRAVLCGSGVGAIATALLALLGQGDHLLMTDSVYSPTRSFCDGLLRQYGVETSYFDPTNPVALADAFRPNTKVVYVESPGSLTMEMTDIPAAAALARARGARLLADNTWGTPIGCNPLRLGADGVIESLTKYVGGHADLLMGVVVGTKETYPRFKKTAALTGQYAAPDEVYLALRGLRTLELRLRRSAASALHLAQWLEQHPAIERVLYPPLPSHPQYALWQRDFTAAAGVFSIEFKQGYTTPQVHGFIDSLTLFGIGYSWGGFESLAVPVELAGVRSVMPPPAGSLVRFSVGLEDAQDLQADLTAGLAVL